MMRTFSDRTAPRVTRTALRVLAMILLCACSPGNDSAPAHAEKASPGENGTPATDPRKMVAIVAEAAREKDYETLSGHMAEKFSYSFGKKPSRSDAISRYRAQPELLDTLADVLGKGCAEKAGGADRYFVCPAAAADEEQAYYGWRAGFRQTADGSWEFIWFIAGD